MIATTSAKTKAEKLVAALKAKGLEPYPYSGRGMFGARCVAVEDFDGEIAGFRGPVYDNMGKGFVAYWPNVRWDGR